MTDFTTLGLSEPMLRSLEHSNFTQATPIQRETIPALLAGRDMIGVAQTGSGKTAAFVIPLLEKLAMYEGRAEAHMPRALILAPTRELALQTTDRIKELSTGMKASCCTIYGGAPYRTQTHILRRGVDILISTPGRLLDHMKRGNIYLDQVEYFVLDEADRMLDLGFIDDVRKINSKITKPHQAIMFSATLSGAIGELKSTLLNDPAQVDVSTSTTVADNLDHWVMQVPGHQKKDLLQYLIETEEPTKSVVFVRTRRDADEIASYLESLGLKAEAIHGDKPQKLRQRTINGFRNSQFDFLVATDVAARGIDVKDISHVFNFDVPVEAESYVHRIGRTARGGASGRAFTLCGKNEFRLIRAIEDILGETLEVIEDHPYRMTKTKKASFSPKKRPAVAARKSTAPAKKKAKGKRAEFFGERPLTDRKKAGGPKKPNKNKGKPKFARDEDRSDARSFRDRGPKQRTSEGENHAKRDSRPAREERPQREGRPPRDGRPLREDRPQRADRPQREGRPQRDDRRPVPAGKPGGKPSGKFSGKPGKPSRPARPGKPGKASNSARDAQGKRTGPSPKQGAKRGGKSGGNQPLRRR